MIRLPSRKDLPNRRGRGTIPQTQSHEKTLPSRDRQTPAAPGQEAFLTPYLTTVRTGTRGNSGFKSVKKYSIPSGKCWKALQITTKNLVQAFGSRRPGVRVPALRPLAASVISLATSFFISLQSSSRAHSAALRFQPLFVNTGQRPQEWSPVGVVLYDRPCRVTPP